MVMCVPSTAPTHPGFPLLVIGKGVLILLLLSSGAFYMSALDMVQEVSYFFDRGGHAAFRNPLEIGYVLQAAARCVVTECYTELDETK